MRYSASEKLELIRTVEGSHLPTKKTLDMLSIPRTTFYRWYDRYLEGGLDALADQSPRPGSVWNRIPQDRRDNLIEFALEHEELTTREWNAPSEVVRPLGYDCPTFRRTKRWLESERNQKILC